jgi:FkbM family methyltransferase
MTITKFKITLPDFLGNLIRLSGEFLGKSRLIHYWMNNRDRKSKRIRILPGGGRVLCDLSIPYEAMVWIEQEEEQDLNILKNLLKSDEIFVDCGANIGIWTITAASIVGNGGKIFAFEPNPGTFETLSQNVFLQEMKDNINLFPNAVGSENARLPFQCCESHNISHVCTVQNKDSILVPVITLDSTLSGIRVEGVKIDVEGFEIEVIKGSIDILSKYKPWLCVEFNTIVSSVNILGDWDVHQYLTELGYVCRLFQDALDSTTKTILPDHWETSGYCNLFYSAK